MLELQPGMLVWTWATFIVLLAVLYKVAWKPLVKMIDARDKVIAEGLEKAEKAREEAEALMAEQKEKMTKTHDEVKEILENSKKMAENTRKEIVDQAKAEADKIIERGKADIDRERQDSITELKKDISNLVVQATSKLIRMSVDEEKHRDLIEESIRKLGQN